MKLSVRPAFQSAHPVVAELVHHPIIHMPRLGPRDTVNPDDPAWLASFLNDNSRTVAPPPSRADHVTKGRQNFLGSFLPCEHIKHHLAEVDARISQA